MAVALVFSSSMRAFCRRRWNSCKRTQARKFLVARLWHKHVARSLHFNSSEVSNHMRLFRSNPRQRRNILEDVSKVSGKTRGRSSNHTFKGLDIDVQTYVTIQYASPCICTRVCVCVHS